MKLLPPLALALATSLVFSLHAGAVTPVSELLSEAQTAYLRGDLPTAKAKFQSVYQLDPKNPTAVAYLRQIQAKEASSTGGTEKTFSNLILPSVQFKEAQLSAVLEALRQQVNKLTEGKQIANFVVQVPEPQASTPITLSLSSVPFTEVLKYVGNLAGVSFTYDKYAITVRPSASVKAEAPAPEAAK
jgi:hypothetical protein